MSTMRRMAVALVAVFAVGFGFAAPAFAGGDGEHRDWHGRDGRESDWKDHRGDDGDDGHEGDHQDNDGEDDDHDGDHGRPGDGKPDDGNKTIVHVGESIQAAIDAAQPGDTIFVTAGVYNENLEITTDGLTLIGFGVRLEPPTEPRATKCETLFGPPPPDQTEIPVNGICVAGDINFETNEILDAVENATIVGFDVRSFGFSGIMAVGTHDAKIVGNTAIDNEEYGIFALVTEGSIIAFNRAENSGEAGIYVGDSPNSDAKVFANEVSGNLFGFFFRDASHGRAFFNRSHDNCVGVLLLGDAPGPVSDWELAFNASFNNTKACEANEEEELPALSGIGVALFGTTDVDFHFNFVTQNTPGGETEFSGGVLVFSGEGGTAPTNNAIERNLVLQNSTDLIWDTTGTGNTFADNACETSDPPDLCTTGSSLRDRT